MKIYSRLGNPPKGGLRLAAIFLPSQGEAQEGFAFPLPHSTGNLRRVAANDSQECVSLPIRLGDAVIQSASEESLLGRVRSFAVALDDEGEDDEALPLLPPAGRGLSCHGGNNRRQECRRYQERGKRKHDYTRILLGCEM